MNIPQGTDFSVFDHYNRACFFCENAKMCQDNEHWPEYSWCISAAIYSCQAIYEIIHNYVNDPNTPEGRWHDFKDEYSTKVRHTNLIANYRLQDFHRGAIALLPNFNAMYGPVTLKTSKQKGSSAVASLNQGKKESTTKRNAAIKYNRPISTHDTKIEADNGEMISAIDILKEYLEDIHPLIKKRAQAFEWSETP